MAVALAGRLCGDPRRPKQPLCPEEQGEKLTATLPAFRSARQDLDTVQPIFGWLAGHTAQTAALRTLSAVLGLPVHRRRGDLS